MVAISLGLGLGLSPGKGGGAAQMIAITSGGGYAGSTYSARRADQWYIDDVAIPGETSTTYTMTLANEGKALRCGESNVIKMWMPTDLDASLKTNGGWWDPKRQVSATGGKVTSIADQFGVRDLSQSVDANRFTLSTVDGYPAMVAPDTGNNCHVAPAAPYSPAYWMFVLQYRDGVDGLFDGYDSLVSTATNYIIWNQAGAGATGATWASQFNKNGQGLANIVLPMPKSIMSFSGTPISGLWSPGLSNSGQTTRGWRGPFFEILALGAVPDAITQARIEGCMAWRHGTQALLPTNHQFKTVGPMGAADFQTLALGPGSYDVLMTFNDGTQEQVTGKTGDYTLAYTRGQLSDVRYQLTSAEASGVPLFAQYAGANALDFYDDFDSASTIDNADTKADGFKWYRGGWFGGASLEADQYSVSGSVLTLGKGSGTSKAVGLKSGISANNANHYVGNQFGDADAIYFEAMIAIDPTQSSAAIAHFPAFWSMSREHISDDYNSSDSWMPGQASNYKRFAEFDVMEFVKPGGASIVGRTYYDASIHDWSGVYNSGWPNDIYNYGQTTMQMGQAIDNQFHRYGGLLVREKNGKPGYLQWMYDRKRASKRQYFKRSVTPPVPPLPGQGTSPKTWNAQSPELAAETYAIFNDHHLLINLMTDSLMPMRVDWVKVWKSA